ncbi:MAG: hypothetical protein WA376_22350, partial [Terrimicrobiaceae bacterium]
QKRQKHERSEGAGQDFLPGRKRALYRPERAEVGRSNRTSRSSRAKGLRRIRIRVFGIDSTVSQPVQWRETFT